MTSRVCGDTRVNIIMTTTYICSSNGRAFLDLKALGNCWRGMIQMGRNSTAIVFLVLAAAICLSGCVTIPAYPVNTFETNGGLQRFANTIKQYRSQSAGGNLDRQLGLFGDVFERVKLLYVVPVADEVLIDNAINGAYAHYQNFGASSDEALIEAALKGMLSSLDAYSTYLAINRQGNTYRDNASIGLNVALKDGKVRVVASLDDTPALRAGIKTSDLITNIDNEPVQGLDLIEVVRKMRGPVNSKIVLTVQRENRSPFDVTITREVINLEPVKWRTAQDVGFIRIAVFKMGTAREVERAVTRFRESNAERLKGIVLDLRNNPGGLLDEVVKVPDIFLQKGRILSTRGRYRDEDRRFNADAGDLANGLPLVVLINSGTASGAEIVAGALKDNGRATVLGTRSAGFGTIQTIITIKGHGGLKLTTSSFHTPSGQSVEGNGISPDVNIGEAGNIKDAIFSRAIEVINADRKS